MKLLYVLSLSSLLSLFSCKSNLQNVPVSEKEAPTVLIDLKDGTSPESLILEFSEINLIKLKQISRPLNIFLFSFDRRKIALDELLDNLKKSPYVEDAQSNKKVTNRN
jgi:hypothetical protein